ncbi:hypothetical protein ERJ75_000534400 [Trypanosoma vivax]|nr:hypothetical protein TRVL_04255 [Trypanosoma vivax]KAH8615906.1 hypothetical protein ERJ75_000534400 [Trypanosoma vivax]
MGRKRGQSLMAQLQRHFPEIHGKLVKEFGRVERGARTRDDSSALLKRCQALLQLLSEHREVLPFVAQGCPACLPALLARVGSEVGSEDVSDGNSIAGEGLSTVILRLTSLMVASGTLTDALYEGVATSYHALVAHVFSGYDETAELAAVILCSTIRLASDGVKIAEKIVGDSNFWREFSIALFGSDADVQKQKSITKRAASPTVLVAVLCVLRCCYSVTSLGRLGTLNSLLSRICSVSLVSKVPCVREEVLLLLFILQLTNTAAEGDRINECIALLGVSTENKISAVNTGGERNGSVDGCTLQAASLAELLMAGFGSAIPVRALAEAVSRLQRDQFDSEARQRGLRSVANLLFAPHVPPGVAAALLVLLPGAVTTVFSAASDVEENVCALACTIFASAIDAAGSAVIAAPVVCKEACETKLNEQNAPTVGGSLLKYDCYTYRKRLAEDFILLGGLVLLEDLLLDYNSLVVVCATRLWQSLSSLSDDMRHLMLASKCIDNLCKALGNVTQDSILTKALGSPGVDMLLLLHGLDTLTKLGDAAERVVPESTVAHLCTIATASRENAQVLSAALSALTTVAAAHPMAATLVLDYEYMNHVFAALGTGNSNDDTVDKENGNGEAEETSCANDRPEVSEADVVYICGSFNIMSAIVSRAPSCVTFEWIETLLAASRCLPFTAIDYKRAFWGVVLETIEASEDGRAFLLEETSFVNIILNSITDCCRDIVQCDVPEGVLETNDSDRGRNCGFDNASRASGSGCVDDITQLMQLLVRVSRYVLPPRPLQLPSTSNVLLEALSFLIAVGDEKVSPVLLVNVALRLMRNEEVRYDSLLSTLGMAEKVIAPELQ